MILFGFYSAHVSLRLGDPDLSQQFSLLVGVSDDFITMKGPISWKFRTIQLNLSLAKFEEELPSLLVKK